MNSKEALERLIKDIHEQGKVISNNPNLIMTLNVNVERFVSILENAKQDLERLEQLENEYKDLQEKYKQLQEDYAFLEDDFDALENESY